MPSEKDYTVSRRGFLKLCGAAAAGAAVGVSPARAAETASKAKGAGEVKSVYSACDMCFNKCGLIARVEDGVVKKLDPNPKFLKSRGMLCARGNAGIRQLYDPDRLKYPLLRKGARGEGKWQRLTWDQALDHAAEKLSRVAEKYTRCGLLLMPGADLQSTFVRRFGEAFGSYNVISHESMCLIAGTRAFLDTFGEVPFADLLNCKYILMAGANRFEALVTPDSIDMMTAMKNGAKLVVLDPRYTKTAALADEWHPIRPHTDMALMLALAHVIVTEKLYDEKWIAEKTYGIEQLQRHVKKYTPEWAEKECDIPAWDIRRMARELAAAAPAAVVYPGRRSSNYKDSTQIRRAYAIVNALLGNWDRPGGLTATRMVGLKGGIPFEPPFYEDNPDDRIDAGVARMMFEEEGSFKIARDAVIKGEPYPVKGWITYKTNPMQTGANRARTVEMINQLDFMMTIDIVMSDTAYMADLVLPSQSYLERMDPCSALQGSSACACVTTRDPVIDRPMFESKPVFWMMKELAKRLDLGEFFDFTMEDFRAAQLKELPDAAAALERDGVYYNPSKLYGIYEGRIFKTKSHKIEIYNQRYADMGVDPLPVYKSPRKIPKGSFRIVVGRNALITQSSSTNNDLLAEFQPTNHLWLHPKPAADLGLKDGDLVEVASPAGSQKIKLKVTNKTRPDTVYMATGFGALSPSLKNIYENGAAISEVLEDEMDKISGNIAMHETLVTVRKAAANER